MARAELLRRFDVGWFAEFALENDARNGPCRDREPELEQPVCQGCERCIRAGDACRHKHCGKANLDTERELLKTLTAQQRNEIVRSLRALLLDLGDQDNAVA